MQTIYFAGGCLWGVQAFVKTLPGVVATEAGRANGAGDSLEGPYGGCCHASRALKRKSFWRNSPTRQTGH